MAVSLALFSRNISADTHTQSLWCLLRISSDFSLAFPLPAVLCILYAVSYLQKESMTVCTHKDRQFHSICIRILVTCVVWKRRCYKWETVAAGSGALNILESNLWKEDILPFTDKTL